MKRWKKILGISILTVFVCVIGITAWYAHKALPVGTGFVAKYLCSSTFISKRDPELVFEEDIKPVNPLAKVVKWKINDSERSVTAKALGLFESKAVFRKGCGCTLIRGMSEDQLMEQRFFKSETDEGAAGQEAEAQWPEGNQGPVKPESLDIDGVRLEKALDAAIAETGPEKVKRTRAVVVVYDGRLAAERYAPGFGPNMSLLGWSMNKSITNALVGVLIRAGKLSLKDPAPVPEWQAPGDPRQKITLDQLMRMSSGLEFEEVYAPLHDATNMLYQSSDFAAYAAEKPLETEPDGKWSYSSGTANIVARIVRQTVEKEQTDYYEFFKNTFFDPMGMSNFVLEPDPSGTFVGSSYGLATLRDWTRFGQLYLQDGMWNGNRILPEGWVKYTTTPTPKAPRGEYGALFWLNAGSPEDPMNRLWPDLPRDAYAASGYQGQNVMVIPSENLVVVRFGATSNRKAWDLNEFVGNVLKSLPQK